MNDRWNGPQIFLKAALKSIMRLAYGAPFRTPPVGCVPEGFNPKRILLLNGSHIGDIVIVTSVLPILRKAYPLAEIGIVTGSWSQMVVKGHPEIAYTHTLDHWRFNRSKDGLLWKFLRFRRTWRAALREIKDLHYDVALSLFTVFPDFLDLSWAARIPVRVGFRQSYFSFLATALVDESKNLFIHQGAHLAEPLRALGIDPAYFTLRRSLLAPSNASALLEVCELLHVQLISDAHYRIIHMGTGAERREFPLPFWRELAGQLCRDHVVLFTGRGEREAENIAIVMQDLPNCVNACDRLSWNGFVAAVRHAEVLYGVESMAGHVAGAVDTRCVVLYGGTAGVARWRPEGAKSTVVTNHLPCAPCLRSAGCLEMTCMKNIDPSDVIRLSN